MKRILSLLLLLAATMFTTALHAQGHFDWVKSYEGSNTSHDNTIVGKDVDSEGNIYIIGHFTPGAQINGVGLLPMTPYGIQCNTQCVIIAKLSSQGDLLWHKAIHANRDEHSRAIGIKCIGDSSIVCMADFTTPTSIQYLYLLDSLYTTVDTSSSTLSANTLMGGTLTGYFKFSTSGELQEKHLLTITYVDSLGQDIMGDRAYAGAPYSSLYYNSTLAIQRFTIDQDANIILDRITNDRMTLNGIETSVANGGISGIKILVDSCHHQLVLQNVMPFKEGNNQLIKVSPHFDSVMADNYLLALDPELDSYFQSTPTEMLTDSNGNVFVAAAFSTSEKGNYSIPLPGRPDLTFDIPATNYRKSLCVQFDKHLNPQHLLQLTESITDSSGIPHSYFWGMNFDDEGNLVILAALEKIWNNFYYDTTLLDIESDSSTLSHSLGFLRIDTAWNLVSYGFSMNTNWFSNGLPRSVVAKNNRILTEACYMYSFSTIDSIYQASHISHGVLSWDYDGRPISFIDYHSPGISDRMNGVILCDSILYMSGMFTAGANLQGVTVPAGAYLAKYVDSAFMAPYVYKGTNDVRIVMAEDGNAFVAYPNPFRQRVNIEYSGQQPITAAYLSDIMGRTEQVELSATAPGRYTLDLTSRPQVAYLLTLVTQDGHRHTVRLLKQSDIFGQ